MNSNVDHIEYKNLSELKAAVAKHHQYLFYYLRSRGINTSDADDIMQQLWLYCLRRLSPDKFSNLAYLRRKVNGLRIDHIRKMSRLKLQYTDDELTLDTQSIPPADLSMEIESSFWEEYKIEATYAERKAFWLFARHDMTHAEISDRLKIPKSTITDMIKRTRAKLREFQIKENL